MKKRITVFTPTFNRAYCLSKCYESLIRQTSKDFIWLIIDDGSSDNTKLLVDKWQSMNNDFEIQYVYKENGGMHTAHNLAYSVIETELNVCIDSDDYLADDAIECILNLWEVEHNDQIGGIVALNIDQNGKLIGNSLPNMKTIKLYDYYNNGGKGDKKLIYRTDIVRKYPDYPIYKNEKFVPLDYKYLLIDQDYSLLVLNRPVCIVEYMTDGSTNNIFRQYRNNPNGFIFMRKMKYKYEKRLSKKFRLLIHYVSNCMLAKKANIIMESPSIILTLLAFPIGLMLYGYTLYRTRE